MTMVAVDLHMHSILSPCGDSDMTPNNIVNMALIKELDIIALTDHNSGKNLPALMEVARNTGLQILPGMEVTTREEAHVLAYFPTLEDAMACDTIIYDHLPNIPNRPDYFGHQYIMDAEDEVVGEVEKLLISATDLSVNELQDIVKAHHGILVPAHIDRKTYSLIASLGFIPLDLDVGTVEISKMMDFGDVPKRYPQVKKYALIHGSDAHYLEDMAEREYFLDLPDLKRSTLLKKLAGKQNDAPEGA